MDLTPIGVFPVGASGCGGDCERADLIGPKNLKCFYGCLGEELFSLFNCEWNKGEAQNRELLSFQDLVSPR